MFIWRELRSGIYNTSETFHMLHPIGRSWFTYSIQTQQAERNIPFNSY